MFMATASPRRSECAILPRIRPSGLVMPSMANRLPLGFTARSIDGTPTASTYWVATWPFYTSWASSPSGATKRPSPWEMATVVTSPTAIWLNQGERLEATRVFTKRL